MWAVRPYFTATPPASAGGSLEPTTEPGQFTRKRSSNDAASSLDSGRICTSCGIENKHARTHARTRTRTRANTHTQTHTHTPKACASARALSLTQKDGSHAHTCTDTLCCPSSHARSSPHCQYMRQKRQSFTERQKGKKAGRQPDR